MIEYPKISPILFQIGPLKATFYGTMWALGFIFAWLVGYYRAKKSHGVWTLDQINIGLLYCIVGVTLGARIGYILFYNFSYYLLNPLQIFNLMNGGMSFHGAVIGVIIAGFLACRKIDKNFFQAMDFTMPAIPLGLLFGRIGNFVNGELWGTPSNLPWAMIFPKDPYHVPRHPSQLYESILEGVALFLIVWFYSAKPKPRMAVSGVFFLFYGIFRFVSEFFRQPDLQIGYIALGWLTLGQLLSIPMIIAGIFFLIRAYTKNKLTVD